MALQFVQRRDERLRVVDQLERRRVGVELADARQRQAEQLADRWGPAEQHRQRCRRAAPGLLRHSNERRQRDGAMQRDRPGHRPGVVVADMGYLMGEDAGDLAERHAAQQSLGQRDRRTMRAAQCVGIHAVWSGKVVDVGQARQICPQTNVAQDIEQGRHLRWMQPSRAELPLHQFRRDRRAVRRRRASGHRPARAVLAADDPAAYGQQQNHSGDRPFGASMIAGPVEMPLQTCEVLGVGVNAAAERGSRLAVRQA